MLFSALGALPLAALAAAVQITVKNSGGNATSAYQYGVMFEDINYSGEQPRARVNLSMAI